MVHFRSPSWLTPAASCDGFSTDAHHHGSVTTAARGGLTPAPACRCRRTYLHLCNSMVTVNRSAFYIRTFPAPFRTHQRPCRNHHRAVQNRMRPRRLTVPTRPDPHPGRPGGHHLSLGPLVQHPAAHAPPRPHSTGRSRSRLLRSNRRRHPGGITHKLRAVPNPGWLTGGDVFDGEAVTLLTSEMRGIGAGHPRRSGRWRTAA